MPVGQMSRSTENKSIADFLETAELHPAGMILEGEAGIGKTTQWLAAVEQGRERGFRVLSARVGQEESVLAYATVADLLGDAADEAYAELPDLQRLAVDRVLFRAGSDGPPTDQWVVAAAFVAIIERLATESPVLLAIDDVQWLDAPSGLRRRYESRASRTPCCGSAGLGRAAGRSSLRKHEVAHEASHPA